MPETISQQLDQSAETSTAMRDPSREQVPRITRSDRLETALSQVAERLLRKLDKGGKDG